MNKTLNSFKSAIPQTGSFVGLVLFALFLLCALVFLPSSGEPFYIKDVFFSMGVSGLAILFLIISRSSVKLGVPRGVPGWGLSFWAMGSVLSLIPAINKEIALEQLGILFSGLALFFILLNIEDSAEILKWVERGFVLAGTGVAVFALKQWVLPHWLQPEFEALGKMRFFSTLGNPNFVGVFLIPPIFFTWRWLKTATRNRKRMFLILNLILLISTLLLVRSKQALLGMAVAGIAGSILFFPAKWKKIFLFSILVGLGLGAVIFFFIFTHTIKGRLLIWTTTSAMIKDHWLLGVGLGNYGFHHPKYQAQIFSQNQFSLLADNAAVASNAHNEILNWFAETGIFGVVGFVFFFGFLIWRGFVSPKVKEKIPEYFLAFLGIQAAMVFGCASLYSPLTFTIWILSAVLYWNLDEAKKSISSRWRFIGSWVYLVPTIFFLTFFSIPRLWSGLLEGKGDRWLKKKDLWMGLKKLEEANQVGPARGALIFKTALVYAAQGNPLQALSLIEEAKKVSENVGLYYVEAELKSNLGRDDEVFGLCRKISQAYPNHVTPHFIMGQILAKKGKKVEARKEFKKVVKMNTPPFNLSLNVERFNFQKRMAARFLSESGQE